jgi:hypothetical protein
MIQIKKVRDYFSIHRASLLIVLLFIAGCQAGDPRFTVETPAGFWWGLWHGAISIVMLIAGLFIDNITIYELNNSGAWYDFGFVSGAIAIYGGAKSGARRKYRKRDIYSTVGQKFDKKFQEKCEQWAKEDGDEEWIEIGQKVEEKLKRKIKNWVKED